MYFKHGATSCMSYYKFKPFDRNLAPFIFYFSQLNVPFKINSAHIYENGKSVGGGKTGKPRERKNTCLINLLYESENGYFPKEKQLYFCKCNREFNATVPSIPIMD